MKKILTIRKRCEALLKPNSPTSWLASLRTIVAQAAAVLTVVPAPVPIPVRVRARNPRR